MGSFFVFASFVTAVLVISCCLECEGRDSINVSDSLRGDQTLVSVKKRFEFGFFSVLGAEKSHRYVGIWYYELIPKTVVWVARRSKPLSDSCGGIQIAEDGNIVVSCTNGEVVPITTNLNGSRLFSITLQLLDSGNLRLVDDRSGDAVWQSFDEPTDTFLHGMNLNGNLELRSWVNPSDPRIGNYSFKQDEGPFVIFKNSLTYHWKNNEPGSFMKDASPVFVGNM